ncbi:MAG: hypothetical protein AAGA81_21075, partial [Acidobacteriota bacterium]
PDNVQNNDGMNRVGDVARFIREETAASPVILYPEDVWTVGEANDPSKAIARYEERYDALDAGQLETAPPPKSCTEEELFEASEKFRRSNVEVSNRFLLRGYLAKKNADSRARLAGREHASPLSALSFAVRHPKIWVSDLGRSYSLSASRGLRRLADSEADCDMTMASDSLRYALNLGWGSETLEINARYSTPSVAHRYPFFDQFRPARRLDHGYAQLQFRALVPRLLGRLTGRSG